MKKHHLTVYVEEDVFYHELFLADGKIKEALDKCSELNESIIKIFDKSLNESKNSLSESSSEFSFKTANSNSTEMSTSSNSIHENKIDFIICIGGDGTLLHTSTLFQVQRTYRKPSFN